jgi:hypothetical protein
MTMPEPPLPPFLITAALEAPEPPEPVLAAAEAPVSVEFLAPPAPPAANVAELPEIVYAKPGPPGVLMLLS